MPGGPIGGRFWLLRLFWLLLLLLPRFGWFTCGATHDGLVLLPVLGMPGMAVVAGGRYPLLLFSVCELVLLLVCVVPWSWVTCGVDSMVGMDIAADIIVLSRV